MNEVTMFEDLWDELCFMDDETVEELVRECKERNKPLGGEKLA